MFASYLLDDMRPTVWGDLTCWPYLKAPFSVSLRLVLKCCKLTMCCENGIYIRSLDTHFVCYSCWQRNKKIKLWLEWAQHTVKIWIQRKQSLMISYILFRHVVMCEKKSLKRAACTDSQFCFVFCIYYTSQAWRTAHPPSICFLIMRDFVEVLTVLC